MMGCHFSHGSREEKEIGGPFPLVIKHAGGKGWLLPYLGIEPGRVTLAMLPALAKAARFTDGLALQSVQR